MSWRQPGEKSVYEMFLSNVRFPCLHHSLGRTTWTIQSRARILRTGQQTPWEWLEMSCHVRWNWVTLWFQVSRPFCEGWVSPPLLLVIQPQDSCLDLKISKILFNLRLCDCSVSLTLVLESPSCELTKPTENTIWSFPPNLQCSLCWVSEVNWWKEWLKDTAANRR